MRQKSYQLLECQKKVISCQLSVSSSNGQPVIGSWKPFGVFADLRLCVESFCL